jgi:NYN domain
MFELTLSDPAIVKTVMVIRIFKSHSSDNSLRLSLIFKNYNMTQTNSNKIAPFIDGANLYATAKTLGFDIDYRRLLKDFQSRGTLLRALYYTPIVEDQEYSSIRPLIDWLDYNGYTVITKPIKEFIDGNGHWGVG